MPVQKMRDGLWVIRSLVTTPTYSHIYSLPYTSLALAAANGAADLAAVTALAQTCSKIRTALAAIAAADSSIHEWCVHLDSAAKVLLVSIATVVPGGTGQDQYTMTQLTVTSAADLVAAHALHRANHTKHLALMAAAAAAVTALASVGSVPALPGQ